MKNEYIVRGIHCKECSRDIEEKFNQLTEDKDIHIDYEKRKAYIPEKVDMEQLKRVAAFEKVLLEPAHEHAASHEDIPDTHHGHTHSHSHEVNFSSGEKAARNMKIVFFINILFAVLEFIFGALFNSAAILTDAVHDLGDGVSVGLAWFFQKISTKEPNQKYSFGHKRFSLLGALITGVVLLAGSFILILNTLPRLFNPEPVHYEGMFWLALFAIAANGYSAWLMSKGTSANESMMNLHMLEDVLGWIGVLVVSVVVRFTEWYVLDPLLSLAIAGFIIWQTWPQFKSTAEIFLDAVPQELDKKKIEQQITDISGVHALSHFHLWSIDGEEHALAVTISIEKLTLEEQEDVKEQIRQIVAPYNITHTTVELVHDPERILN